MFLCIKSCLLRASTNVCLKVLHATSSIEKSLLNVKELLKP